MAFKDKQRVNLFLDPNVVDQARLHALTSRMSLSRFFETAIAEKILKIQRSKGPTSKEIDKQVKELKRVYKEYR